jgi:serine-type D-Ala-D-Ala carboxypeptidase (penicillin-binding protein 5/6)
MPRKASPTAKLNPPKTSKIVKTEVITTSPFSNHLLLILLLVSVILILAGIALALPTSLKKDVALKSAKSESSGIFSPSTPVPTLIPSVTLKPNSPAVPEMSARGVFALDEGTQTVLFAKNEDTPLLPASTTKIATALVALKAYDPNEVITISNLPRVYGEQMGLRNGEQITVINLMYGLLVYSANDAAEVLAAHYPGGRSAFMDAMNQLAQDEGLTKTHFTNPVGYDEYLHFSTAHDLVKLAQAASKNETFSQIVATQDFQVTSVDGGIVHRLISTNQLLGKVDGVIGVKTGTTPTSGESLITRLDRNGHKVTIAMLGSVDRFGETKALIDWIYNNYEWKP